MRGLQIGMIAAVLEERTITRFKYLTHTRAHESPRQRLLLLFAF